MEGTGETDSLPEETGFEPSAPRPDEAASLADALNARGVATARDGWWHTQTVKNVGERALSLEDWCRVAADTAIWPRKVRDNGRQYGREYRPADRRAPGTAPSPFLPSYCRHSAPILRSGSPRAASCRSSPR
jgi:hypothetical protein